MLICYLYYYSVFILEYSIIKADLVIPTFVHGQTKSKLYLLLDFINGGHLFFQLYRHGTFKYVLLLQLIML